MEIYLLQVWTRNNNNLMPKKKEAFTKKMKIGNLEELNLLNLVKTPEISGLREYLTFLENLNKNASMSQIETTKSKTSN